MTRLIRERAVGGALLVVALLAPATLAEAQQGHDAPSGACTPAQGHDGTPCTAPAGAGSGAAAVGGATASSTGATGNAATTGASGNAATTGGTVAPTGGNGQAGAPGTTGGPFSSGTTTGGGLASSGTVAPPNAAATPELNTLTLLGTGLAGTAGYLLVRRRARGATPRA